jgi:rifampin ADP-ribosylating transferase
MKVAAPRRYYHGTRTERSPGDLMAPAAPSAIGDHFPASTHVLVTPNPDEAIWSAELAAGDGPPRVSVVEPLGASARVSEQSG